MSCHGPLVVSVGWKVMSVVGAGELTVPPSVPKLISDTLRTFPPPDVSWKVCVPVVSDTPVPVTKTDTFGAYAGVGITRLLPKAVQLEPMSVEYQAANVVLPLAVERTSLIRTVPPTLRTELPKSPFCATPLSPQKNPPPSKYMKS